VVVVRVHRKQPVMALVGVAFHRKPVAVRHPEHPAGNIGTHYTRAGKSRGKNLTLDCR
jgi:hypothetical protein